MEDSTRYDINFFKPHTPFLKDATRLIWIGITIWFLATYGFHILLKTIEKPTPEPGYVIYEKVFPKLIAGSATQDEIVDISKVYLALIGKSVVLQKNTSLKKAFTSTLFAIIPEEQKELLKSTIQKTVTDKKKNVDFIAEKLGVNDNPAMKAAIPYALIPLSENDVAMGTPDIPTLMDRYLIHNQSILTDSKFLGFPFHYFYTAIFLLTLFVLICLVYCKAIDRVMKKYDLEKSFE